MLTFKLLSLLAPVSPKGRAKFAIYMLFRNLWEDCVCHELKITNLVTKSQFVVCQSRV